MPIDLDAIRRDFDDRDDEALLRIASSGDERYLPEVAALARSVLAGRGVDCTAPGTATRVEALRERDLRLAGEDKPLHPLAGIVCLLAGVVVSVIIAVVMAANGRMQAARSALMWCLIGMGLKLLLAAVLYAVWS